MLFQHFLKILIIVIEDAAYIGKRQSSVYPEILKRPRRDGKKPPYLNTNMEPPYYQMAPRCLAPDQIMKPNPFHVISGNINISATKLST